MQKKNKEKLEKDLNRLSNKITSQIDSYVKNFDVIKEFYSRSKSKKPEEIKNALLEMYNNEILDLYSSSGINTILEGSENQKDFSEAFKKYKESIITYNKEKSRNDNLNKIRSSLDTLIKILPEYKRSASHLNKSFQNLPQQYINLSTDSLATLSSAINDIQESRNPTTIRDTITNKISHYNSDKVKNLNLKKRTSEVFKILLFANQQLDTKIVIDTSKLKSDSNWKSEIEAISKNLNTDSEAELKKAKNNVNSNIILITHSIGFLDFYLKSLLNDLINKKNLNLAININSENGLKVTEEFSEYISKSYIQLKELAEKNTITIADVYNIENNIIPQLLKYSFYTEKTELKTTITNFRILSALLKAKIIVDANKDGDLKYDESLNSILTFVSNLDKLDKAETYQSVIDLIQENNENVAKCLTDDFKPIYTLFINGIKKYIVLNTNEQYVEVDVVSFLNDLQQYYNKENKSWFSLYFTLGISENFFLKKTTLPGTSNSISNVGLASEKIGAQFTFYTFGKQDAFKNIIKDKVYTNYKNPFINKMYAIIYASGLLYTLANTTTNENFDFPHVGAGGGFRFYNALDVNFSYALPFIDGQNFGKNGFISIGLDVPLGEYLERLGEK